MQTAEDMQKAWLLQRSALAAQPRPGGVGRIMVTRVAGHRTQGKLVLRGEVIPCALGRSGVTHRKREGDGATPAGRHGVVALLIRRDRMPPIGTALPQRAIRRVDGWCDDVSSVRYNRPIGLPAAASHERLWREDAVYDLLLTLDYNLKRPLRGRGSAIFFHVARENWEPTEGCVAIGAAAMRRLLPRLTNRSHLVVRP